MLLVQAARAAAAMIAAAPPCALGPSREHEGGPREPLTQGIELRMRIIPMRESPRLVLCEGFEVLQAESGEAALVVVALGPPILATWAALLAALVLLALPFSDWRRGWWRLPAAATAVAGVKGRIARIEGRNDWLVLFTLNRRFGDMWEGWTKNLYLLFGRDASAMRRATVRLLTRPRASLRYTAGAPIVFLLLANSYWRYSRNLGVSWKGRHYGG